MPGITALRRVQIGAMSALNSTTDPATTYWRGTGVLDDLTEVQFPDEYVGLIGGANRSYIAKQGGEIELEADATFEQLPYLFNAGIHTTTGTTDAGTGVLWTWNIQAADSDPVASTDITYLVVEGGNNQQAEVMRSALVREMTLSGEQGQAVMVTATLEGQAVSTQSFTSGLSVPSVETILMSKAKLYIDPSTDTIGTTQKSGTLISMELPITTGWVFIPVGDGQLYPTATKRVGDEITLNITFEYDASATAEITAWRNQTERALRLIWTGNNLTTGGTHTTKKLTIDLYGKWVEFSPLDEADGNDRVTGTFRVGYSTSAAKKGTISVVNELTSLP